MRPDEDAGLLNTSLADLIEKFSQNDVIGQMEKEYQSAPARLISTSLIDDTEYVKEVLLPDDVLEYFSNQLLEKGFYNPLVVRPRGERYEVILGRKRFLGAKRAGILSLPCAVADVGDEEELLMLLADTRDHRDNNIVEMALVCGELSKRFGYSQQTLADLSHQSRSQITNTMRILRLPQWIRDEICLGTLSYGHARALVSLNEADLSLALGKIHEEKLSVRETENLVKTLSRYDEDNAAIALKNAFGANITNKTKSITFSFDSEEAKQLFIERILSYGE